MFTLRNKKGFTLIELMIVVAILGILAAVAIPMYINYQYKARSAEVPVSIDAIKRVSYQTLVHQWLLLVLFLLK